MKSLILYLLVLLFSSTPCRGDPTEVTLKQGVLKGKQESSLNSKVFYSFKAIPFAQPPTGNKRFEPPEPADPWDGVLDGTREAPICPQPDLMSMFGGGGPPKFEGQEDCLYLNIFSPMPEGNATLPVLFYIHGGAYFAGSASEVFTKPDVLMDHDIVLVVIQYRLGTLGFLSTGDDVAPGNMGMLDQTLAMKWVQQNIDKFGGDPLQVTIAGTSAGSASVHLQLLSHTSLGYFKRAIMQSGTALSPWAVSNDHRTHAYIIAKHLGCHQGLPLPEECSKLKENSPEQISCVVDQMSSEQVIGCLKKKPFLELVPTALMFMTFLNFPFVMTPRVHKNFLMKHPNTLIKENRFKKLDMMFGYTEHDGSLTVMPLYSNEAARSALKYNFQFSGPTSLSMNPLEIAPLNQTIRIFDHYVGNINFDLEDKDNVCKVYTDALFWYGLDASASYHSSDPTFIKRDKHVYVHNYNYRGTISLIALMPAAEIAKDWVGHADDCMLLFSRPLNDQDKEMAEKMAKSYVSFMVTGKPTFDGLTWEPYTNENRNVLFIQKDPKMATPKAQEREFWRSLPLKVNLELFPESVKNLTKKEAPKKTEQPEPEVNELPAQTKQESSPAGKQEL